MKNPVTKLEFGRYDSNLSTGGSLELGDGREYRKPAKHMSRLRKKDCVEQELNPPGIKGAFTESVDIRPVLVQIPMSSRKKFLLPLKEQFSADIV